jgi:hypothetical protein
MNNIPERPLDPPESIPLSLVELEEVFLHEIRFTYEDKIIGEMEKIINEAEERFGGFCKEVYFDAVYISWEKKKILPILFLIKNEHLDLKNFINESSFHLSTMSEFLSWLVENLVFDYFNL